MIRVKICVFITSTVLPSGKRLQKAIENGHRNSGLLVYQRVIATFWSTVLEKLDSDPGS